MICLEDTKTENIAPLAGLPNIKTKTMTGPKLQVSLITFLLFKFIFFIWSFKSAQKDEGDVERKLFFPAWINRSIFSSPPQWQTPTHRWMFVYLQLSVIFPF